MLTIIIGKTLKLYNINYINAIKAILFYKEVVPLWNRTYTSSKECTVSEVPQIQSYEESAQGQDSTEQGRVWLTIRGGQVVQGY